VTWPVTAQIQFGPLRIDQSLSGLRWYILNIYIISRLNLILWILNALRIIFEWQILGTFQITSMKITLKSLIEKSLSPSSSLFDYLYAHKSTLLRVIKSLLKRQTGFESTTSINFYMTRDKSITRIIFHDFRRQVQKPSNPFDNNDRPFIS